MIIRTLDPQGPAGEGSSIRKLEWNLRNSHVEDRTWACWVGEIRRMPAVAKRNNGVEECSEGGICVRACSSKGAR